MPTSQDTREAWAHGANVASVVSAILTFIATVIVLLAFIGISSYTDAVKKLKETLDTFPANLDKQKAAIDDLSGALAKLKQSQDELSANLGKQKTAVDALASAITGQRTPPPVTPGVLPADDLKTLTEHAGKEADVEGIVLSVHTGRSGARFLNYGSGKDCFAGVIFIDDVPKFEKVLGDLGKLEGKSVRLHGEIELYQGHPEIKLTNPSQVIVK